MFKNLIKLALLDFMKYKNIGDWGAQEIVKYSLISENVDEMEVDFLRITKDLNCWEKSAKEDFEEYLRMHYNFEYLLGDLTGVSLDMAS